MENTTIFLISNGSHKFFPKNSLTNFKNKLPNDIFLNGSYEVAVESVGFSKSFKQIHIPEDDFPSFFISKSEEISYVRTPPAEKDAIKAKRLKILQQELNEVANYINDNNKETDQESNKYYRLRRRSTENTDSFENEFSNLKTFPFYFRDNETYSKTKLEEYFKKISILTGVNAYYDSTEDKTIFNLTAKTDSTNKSYFVVMHETFMSSFNINTSVFLTLPHDVYYWEPMPDNNSVYAIDRENSEVTLKINIELNEVFYKNEKYYAVHIQSHRHPLILENVEKVLLPSLVKLKCMNIKPQIVNDTYSQDLVVFCPDFEKKEKFFYHEFDSLQYVPLSNTILKDIEIGLCDEKNRFLQLSSGTPTIVKLSLKKMDTKKESFNVRLTSSPNKEYKNNKSSSFRVVLPVTLNLDRSFKVALTSISHPNDFNTFLEDEDSRSMAITWRNNDTSDSTLVRHKLTLKEHYTNSEDLVNDIHNFLQEKNIGSAYIKEETLHFYFDRNCILIIGNYLLRILGFTHTSDMANFRNYSIFPIRNTSSKEYIINEEKIVFCFQDPINLNLLDAKYICMYANFISPVILAGEFHKLLRIIPIRETKTGFVITEFKHKDFYELQNTEIKEIAIELRAHDGELINFKSKQNIILNLLFTNKID